MLTETDIYDRRAEPETNREANQPEAPKLWLRDQLPKFITIKPA